jgi:hypothetical protein
VEILELKCKNCGSAINLADINTLTGIMSCKHCGAIYKIAPSAAETQAAAANQQRPEIPLPEKFKVQKTLEGLEISWRWFKAVHVFMIFFAIAWNGFMVMWHSMAIASGEYFMSLFGIVHTAVGIGLIYYVLAGFLNQTSVSIKNSILQIRHAPLPWRGNQSINSSDIDQVYTKERISRGKNGTSYTYEVYLILASNRSSIRILSGLDDAEQGLYIEQTIESYLGIADSPVAGEIPR